MNQSWNLIRELTITEFKLRYHSMILGFTWSMLKPALLLISSYIIFSIILPQHIPQYAAFLCIGIIFWNFLLEATTISMNNILEKRNMIKSVYFPRTALVWSSCLNAAITMGIYLGLLLLIIAIISQSLTVGGLLLFLVIGALLFALVAGIAFFLTALYVEYRDILHIWQISIHIGFWITPIVYTATLIPEKFQGIYFINPLTQILFHARNALLYNQMPPLTDFLIITGICIGVMIIGYYVYHRKSKYFAENI